MPDLQTEDRLRAALRQRADEVRPTPALPGILHRAHDAAPSRSPWRTWAPALAAGVAAAVIVGVVVQAENGSDGTAPSVDSPRREVTVYYVGDRPPDAGAVPRPSYWRLASESVTTRDTGDAGYDAVRALLSIRPSDPDYSNGYDLLTIEPDPITDVHSVSHEAGVITVDLTEDVWDPYRNVACICPSGEVITQQLVWTVQEALGSTDPVQVLVDGEPTRGIYTTRLDGPNERHPAALSPVLIESPVEGDTVTGLVRLTGSWRTDRSGARLRIDVLRNDEVVDTHEAPPLAPVDASAPARRELFSYRSALPAGDYVVRATVGVGDRVLAEDTKELTVSTDASAPTSTDAAIYLLTAAGSVGRRPYGAASRVLPEVTALPRTTDPALTAFAP